MKNVTFVLRVPTKIYSPIAFDSVTGKISEDLRIIKIKQILLSPLFFAATKAAEMSYAFLGDFSTICSPAPEFPMEALWVWKVAQ